MDAKDPVPAVMLVLATDLSRSGGPTELAIVVAFVAVKGLSLVVGVLSAGGAALAAWRSRERRADIARPAAWAAVVGSGLGLLGAVVTFSCCESLLWLGPAALAVTAAVLARDLAADDRGQGWGSAP